MKGKLLNVNFFVLDKYSNIYTKFMHMNNFSHLDPVVINWKVEGVCGIAIDGQTYQRKN
jgi:hypothetical protein